MSKAGEWTAEDVAVALRAVGLPIDVKWVQRRVPGARWRYPDRAPQTVGNARVWEVGAVRAWMRGLGLHRKRHLVRIEELARLTGLGYWQTRRRHEPVLVFTRSEKWYEAP